MTAPSMRAQLRAGSGWLPRQRGAALVVGLVLMLALTILGISGVNTSTLELTMTANSQAKQLAFQAAESGIEMALTGSIDTGAVTTRATHAFGDGSYEVDTELLCVAMTRVPDGAHREDSNARALHFELTAVGRGPRNAVSRLVQGFYVVVPSTIGSGFDSGAGGSADGDCQAQTVCLGPGCATDHELRLPVRTYWRQEELDD